MVQNYRPEIDGLRAIAILPVVLYHGGAEFIPGGFVGVDIFFVLSGYLITRILLNDFEYGAISIFSFYERRVRRILPALFAMLASVTVLGWFLLLPDAYAALGETMLASLFWVANWHFLQNLDYFAPAAEHQPFLHLWSLSVEEQFYLIFPLFLIFILKRFPDNLVAILAAVASLSFLSSVFVVGMGDTATAFFSTPLRAWELLCGAVLAAAPPPKMRHQTGRITSLLGAGLIVAGLFGIQEQTAFPGLTALLPVGGTMLLLIATSASPDGTAARLLGWRPLRCIGLISYSWYLWHWPLLVLFRKIHLVEPPQWQLMLIVLLSAIPAVASWRFVEQPFRQVKVKNKLGTQPILMAGAVTALFCMVSTALMVSDGFESRLPENSRKALLASGDISDTEKCSGNRKVDWSLQIKACLLGSPDDQNSLRFVLWGDSHAQAMAPAFEAAALKTGTTGLMIARGGCPPLLDVNQAREGFDDCTETYSGLLDALATNKDVQHVFLVARWAIYATGTRYRREAGNSVFIQDGDSVKVSPAENRLVFQRSLQKTINALTEIGVKVHFVHQVPEAEVSVPDAQAYSLWFGIPHAFAPTAVEYLARQSVVTEALKSVEKQVSIIDSWTELCRQDPCPLLHEGTPIYRDGNHLTSSSAARLSGVFEKSMNGHE